MLLASLYPLATVSILSVHLRARNPKDVRALLIQNGDLVLGQRGYVEVTGVKKVAQDVSFALQEPYGADRFHGGWGSRLNALIGTATSGASTQLVQNEVNRVIQNYITVQSLIVQAAILSNQTSSYTNDDIISSVTNVSVSQSLTTISVLINLVTASNQPVVLPIQVSL